MRPACILPLLSLGGLLLLGCGEEREERGSQPLIDRLHAPDVLTESRRVELPPSLDGNRFLRAWWPLSGVDGLVPAPQGARLEVVNLGGRPRVLRLSTEVRSGPTDGGLRVVVAGRTLGPFPLAATLDIALPADLPLGRVAVDVVTGAATLAVRGAQLSTALPAGEAVADGGHLVQSGDSLVDLHRRLAAPATLRGVFVPPARPRTEQRFELRLEGPRGETVGFAWSATERRVFGGERRIELPLEPGWVRIRCVARGEGPPARWDELRLVAEEIPAPAAAVAPPAPPRLVVVYVLDALRADFVGHLGGDPAPTPTIDRLAAEGATFTRHFAVAPNTLPSTKSLFTGSTFLRHGGRALPAEGPATLAERFAAAGYRTGLFTGNGHLTPDYGLARGFEHAPESTLVTDEAAAERPYNDNAERVHAAAIDWLETLSPQDRAFLFLQTIHPHNPYDPPEPYRTRYTAGIRSTIDGSTETLLDVKHQRIKIDADDRRRLRGLYTGGLAYADAELARFLERLLERYPREEVLLVVTSDHGEELFDHGGVLHGYTLYDEQLWIPLVVSWPGRVDPRRLDAATDALDLHATLASLAAGGDVAFPGAQALWPALLGGPFAGKEVLFAGASSLEGGIFMARTSRLKVVWAPRADGAWGMGQGLGRSRDVEHVFDLVEDPEERRNLAGEPLPEARWLRSRLLAWIELAGATEAAGTAPVEVDEETRRSLEALGYL